MIDVIIVGKGPAGVSASLYTVRAGLKTMVIGLSGTSALMKADKIENYFGLGSVSGEELCKAGEKQAKALGVEVLDAEVLGIEKYEHFSVKTTEGSFDAKTVLIATGSSRKSAGIPDEKRLTGKGISYCAVCDGFFYRGKPVGVVGDGNYAINEANELSHVASHIYILTNGKQPTFGETKYEVVTEKIKSVHGLNQVEGVELENGREVALEGLFVAVGTASATDFARKMGVIFEGNDIKVNAGMETNIKGLFAAGDCIGGFRQISTAVGGGALAAKGMIDYVRAMK